MRTNGRINVSHSPSELLDLAAKVYVKHQADGESSPLNSLVDNNWVVTGPKIAQALEIHQEAEGLRKKMEELYRERDIMLPEIEEIVRFIPKIRSGLATGVLLLTTRYKRLLSRCKNPHSPVFYKKLNPESSENFRGLFCKAQ